MAKMNRVKVQGRIFDLNGAHDLGAWQRALADEHAYTKRAVCMCLPKAGLELVIRCCADKYHVAKLPHTGPAHHSNCHFHDTEAEFSSKSVYAKGVIEPAGQGMVKVKLRTALHKAALKTVHNEETNGSSSQAGAGQRAISTLGLLHYLWEQAGINLWQPYFAEHRHWAQVAYRVKETSGRVLLSKGLILRDAMMFIGMRDQSHNQQVLAQALAQDRRFYVLGLFEDFRQSKFNHAVNLWQIEKEGIALWAQDNLVETTRRRFPMAFAAAESGTQDRQQIIFLVVEPITGGRNVKVLDIALMTCTTKFIPVDSSYELRLANGLVEAQRPFSKPLRFDAGEDQVLPDFLLLDATADGTPMPLEVFGMDTEEYRRRKAEKAAFYHQNYGPKGWWSWEANKTPQWPALPPKYAKKSKDHG